MASLYLHFPFCKQACHYCNFHFSTGLKNKTALISALKKELVLRKSEVKTPLQSIYFGGGSPSLLSLSELEEIIGLIYIHYRVLDGAECTLELNPDDGHPEYLKGVYSLGINRLSIGVQSFLDRDLKLMNRAHEATDSLRILDEVSKIFDNYSLDLIYGMPGSSLVEWQKTLDRVLAFQPPHISAYALTVEPKTVLHRWVQTDQIQLLDDEQVQQQYDHLVQRLESEGYHNYEFSNFGKQGFYAVNNSNYWKGLPYIGIGPSAHSYDGASQRSWNVANNAKYIQALEKNRLPLEKETLTPKDRYNEYIMIGLRTEWGVSKGFIETQFGPIYARYLEEQAEKQIAANYLYWDGDILRIPVKARFLSDGIAAELFMLHLA